MRTRGLVVGVVGAVLTLAAGLAGCGDVTSTGSGGEPFTLPVGPTRWDASAPAWYADGTLHVGERSVELGDGVDEFVLGATGAYWVRRQTLMFTSAEGRTREVADVGWANLAVSADHSVVATVDQSRGPTDEFGTHVMQVAVFDTRTGAQLYRTPDRAPADGADLADLYGELMPMLGGVSRDRVFFDEATISLADGSREPVTQDDEGVDVYPGYAETLFTDGYHVGLRGEGRHREVGGSEAFGTGRLSPDRSTVLDVGQWPTDAVAYDAETGRQRALDAPWDHFSLGGWTDDDTFFGVAERIDDHHPVDVLRARQVVTCELRSLACTPVGRVIRTPDSADAERPAFLLEGRVELL
ncbi:hypothetical protein [Nocardioides sp.]|uniref:hypothetical protein n=1 Tax=Nocardioides sp. TaxID=35761 RepID=UPI00378383F8